MDAETSRAVFRVDAGTWASERNALVFASRSPIDTTHMVVGLCGELASRNGPFSERDRREAVVRFGGWEVRSVPIRRRQIERISEFPC
jgi:hypothetical protein